MSGLRLAFVFRLADSSAPLPPVAPFFPVEKTAMATSPLLMIAFAPPPPQLGGLAPGLRPAADLHISKSLDWQLMPLVLTKGATGHWRAVLVPQQLRTMY